MRIFYGWIILAAAFFIYAAMVASVVSFGVFIEPLEDAGFGWTRWEITMTFSIFMITNGILSIVTGHLSDRYGPRIIVAAGAIFLGLGIFLSSYVTSIWQLYVFYGFLGGLGFAGLFVPINATLSRWFIAKRGLALGTFAAGGGIGGLVMSPLLQSWISDYGWDTAFIILAIIIWSVIIPLSLVIRKEPAVMGLRPLGAAQVAAPSESETESTGETEPGTQAASQGYTASQALGAGQFWIFTLATTLIFTGILMAQINMYPHATDHGIAAGTAAIALGVASAFNTVGRLGVGAVSDRMGTKRTFGFSILLASAMLFWLIAVRQPWMLFLFAVPFGFAYGGCVPQIPRAVAELFGTRSMGAIMGINGLFGSFGPAFGPALGAFIHDKTDSYFLAFLGGGLAALIGFGLIMLLKLPKKR